MSKIKVWEDHWDVQDVKDHPNWLFIFGDNLKQKGKGGQAVIRDEPNTFGLPTKLFPTMDENAFFSYKTKDVVSLASALASIEKKVNQSKYDKIVFSANGYGNGLAKLPEKAPHIYTWICDWVKEMIKKYGNEEDINKLKF